MQVETKTRGDIEEKKKQLRLLVGDSYRDLISSADTILAMSNCCNTVLEKLRQMQVRWHGPLQAMHAASAHTACQIPLHACSFRLYAM